MSEIRNLVVYMTDGVRWDSHPDSVSTRGLTFRTIASSLHTPTAIASMLTGLYLPSHGVRGFTDQLPGDVQTVLDWLPNDGISDSPGNFNHAIYGHLLGRYEQQPLTDLEEPFSWFMRDAGGHAPYNGFNECLQTKETVRSYLQKHGGDEARMRRDYENAVDSSVDRFERFVLDPLKARGILERTLVVFASDHGQMLGEYGHVGESYPACPEVVYVPTTFIHPSLETEQSDDLFRHVDIAPTVAGLVDHDVSVDPTDGVDVLGDMPAEYGANFYDRPYPSLRGEFSYIINSLWDNDGGHVFVESDLWDKIRVTAGLLTRIPAGIHLRRNRSLGGLKMLFENQRTWGQPDFSKTQAKNRLGSIVSTDRAAGDLELSEETAENLEELGYL